MLISTPFQSDKFVNGFDLIDPGGEVKSPSGVPNYLILTNDKQFLPNDRTIVISFYQIIEGKQDYPKGSQFEGLISNFMNSTSPLHISIQVEFDVTNLDEIENTTTKQTLVGVNIIVIIVNPGITVKLDLELANSRFPIVFYYGTLPNKAGSNESLPLFDIAANTTVYFSTMVTLIHDPTTVGFIYNIFGKFKIVTITIIVLLFWIIRFKRISIDSYFPTEKENI